MAVLDRRLKQRMVGAAVLVALGVVFLPMLFNREDEQRAVRVEAPPMPPAPRQLQVEPGVVAVPEVAEAPAPDEPAPAPVPAPAPAAPPAASARPAPSPPASAAAAALAPAPAQPPASRLDGAGVPVSWTVQLVSLSNRARAEELQRQLRSQGFNAYIRAAGGMNRVFVGPLIERAAAERLREQLARQHKLSPIVVRFEPERR